MELSKKIFEVYYQDSPTSEITTDVVFSRYDAESSILDYFNERILQQTDSNIQLKDFLEIQRFQQLHPEFQAKAWFIALDEHTPNVVSLDSIGSELKQLLQEEDISLPKPKVKELLEESLSNAQQKQEVAQEDEDVWLVQVGEDDIAVYLGQHYIDAVSKSDGDDFEDIIATAQLFSERNQTDIKKHQFTQPPKNWNWAKIEKIMDKSGLRGGQPCLLDYLRQATSVKINQQTNKCFELKEEAYQRYISTGDGSQDFFEAQVMEEGEDVVLFLSIDDLVNAIEVKPNTWICNDIAATELVIDQTTGLISISSLLR